MGGHWKALAAVAVVVGLAAPLASSSGEDVPDIVIAEVMSANRSTIFDTDGESADWIEIWNRSTSAVDLTGWRLRNDEDDDAGNDWSFPRVLIESGDRMVIFLSGKADRHRLHAAFRLSGEGEYIGLSDASGRTVAEYREVPALGFDVSYGIGSDNRVGVLTTPTPGLPNSPVKRLAAAKPQLSRAGGYIDGPVSIAATTATVDAQLWYTTDGSTPTAGHGTQYSGPIVVERTTTLRIVATKPNLADSFVASATFLVMAEVLAQSRIPLEWSTTTESEQVYLLGLDQEYVASHSAQVAAALQAAPTLSITTDLDNLVDETNGIYSNPTRSGRVWERPASIELIDGSAGFQINGGLRIKGGFSRQPTNPKHSFRLTFGHQYEGLLQYPLFGPTGIQTFASVDLRTEQNYAWSLGSDRNTLLRDQFTRESQGAVGDPSTRSKWVHLFLDGQYWGLYMLRDDITGAHAKQLWGGSLNDYDVLKQSDIHGYEVADGHDDEWLKLWEAISDGVLTDVEFGSIASSTDLANLADFMLVNIYVGNTDAVPSGALRDYRGNNWQAVRGDGQPWRFFIDDAEHTMGASDHSICIDRTKDFAVLDSNPFWNPEFFNPGWLHQVLLTRSEYGEIVRDRATELFAEDGPLGTSANLARWQALRDYMVTLVEAEAARWGNWGRNQFGKEDWEAEVDWVQTQWFPRRTEIVRAQLAADGLIVNSVVADFPQDKPVRWCDLPGSRAIALK